MLPNTSRLSLNTRRDAPVDASFPAAKVVTVAEALQRRTETLQRRIDVAKQIAKDELQQTRNAPRAMNAFSERFTTMERMEFGEDLAKQAWAFFSLKSKMKAYPGMMDAVDPTRKIVDGWGGLEDIQAWNHVFLSGAVPRGWQTNLFSGEPWRIIVRLTPLAAAYMKSASTVFALKATLLLDFKRQYDEKVNAYWAAKDAAERQELETDFFKSVPRSFEIPGMSLDDYTISDSIRPMLREAYHSGILETPTGHFRVLPDREFKGRV